MHLFTITMLILTFTAAALVFLLIRSMGVSIYRYRNIVIIGSLLATIELFAYMLWSRLFGGINEMQFSVAERICTGIRAMADPLCVIVSIAGAIMLISNIEIVRREGKEMFNLEGVIMSLILLAGAWPVRMFAGYLAVQGRGSNTDVLMAYACHIVSWIIYCLFDYLGCITFGIIVLDLMIVNQRPSYDRDRIIILGCTIAPDGGLRPLLKRRTDTAIDYGRQYEMKTEQKMIYIPSGGKGEDEIISEGLAIEQYLVKRQVEPAQIYSETSSTNTYENFREARKIIEAMAPSNRVAFSTTNYHVLRSGMIARELGYSDIEGIASSTRWYFWLNGFVREVAAILVRNWKSQILTIALMAILGLIIANY